MKGKEKKMKLLDKEEYCFHCYAQIRFFGRRSSVLISSILAATMKSFKLRPPANRIIGGISDLVEFKI